MSLSAKAQDFLGRRRRNPRQREFFDDRADVWDMISTHDPGKINAILDMVGIEEDMDILDVGTGTGVMIPFYIDRMSKGTVTAIDFSERMIDVARRKNGDDPRVSFVVGDIYDYSPGRSYDLVMCYSCFPHFPDPVLAIRSLSATMRYGGMLCIAHSTSKDHINRVHEEGGHEICADYLPDMDTMVELMESEGLRVVFSRDDEDFYIVISKFPSVPEIV